MCNYHSSGGQISASGHGSSCGETSAFSHSRGVSSGTSTTDSEHSCTAQCARLHLSEKIQTLEQELRRLCRTLPINDYIWYRSRVEQAFDEILFQGLD